MDVVPRFGASQRWLLPRRAIPNPRVLGGTTGMASFSLSGEDDLERIEGRSSQESSYMQRSRVTVEALKGLYDPYRADLRRWYVEFGLKVEESGMEKGGMKSDQDCDRVDWYYIFT
jgi:hypothetical protein